MISDVEHLCMNLFAILKSSLVKVPVQIFCPFFKKLSCLNMELQELFIYSWTSLVAQ